MTPQERNDIRRKVLKILNLSDEQKQAVAELSGGEVIVYMQELCRLISLLQFCYYQNNNPIVSDWDYDQIFNHLKELEDAWQICQINSPTLAMRVRVC